MIPNGYFGGGGNLDAIFHPHPAARRHTKVSYKLVQLEGEYSLSKLDMIRKIGEIAKSSVAAPRRVGVVRPALVLVQTAAIFPDYE
jgi:hypothetical protein